MHRYIRPGSPIVLIPVPRESLLPLYSSETGRDEDDSPPLSPLTPPSAQRSNGSARIEDDSPPFPPLSLPPHRKSKDSARLVDSSPPFPTRSPLTPRKSDESTRLEDSSPPFPHLSPLPHRKSKDSARIGDNPRPVPHLSPPTPREANEFARPEDNSPMVPRLSTPPARELNNDSAAAEFEMPDFSPILSPRARRRARKRYWALRAVEQAQGSPPPQRQLLPVPQQIEDHNISDVNPLDLVLRVRRTDGTKVEMRMSQMVLDGFHNVIADWSESGKRSFLDESNVSSAYWRAMQQGWQPHDRLRTDYSDDGRRKVADTLSEVELGLPGPNPEPLRILTLRGTRARQLKPRRPYRPGGAKSVGAKSKSRSAGAKSKSRPVSTK